MDDETGAARVRKFIKQAFPLHLNDDGECDEVEVGEVLVFIEDETKALKQRLAEVEQELKKVNELNAAYRATALNPDATIDALQRENQELKDKLFVKQNATDVATKRVDDLECELAAVRAERDRKQEGMDVLKAEMLRLRDKWEARLRVLEEQAPGGPEGGGVNEQ